MGKRCPLCSELSALFYADGRHRFFSCPKCLGIFRDPEQLPGEQEEKERYLLHQDARHDPGYLKFVDPLLEAVKRKMPKGSRGLDYGCGHSPVISEVLKAEGFTFSIYDPFFYPEKAVLDAQYDFITCCEVVEHFHRPKKEFESLHGMLKKGGKLFCMTYLYEDAIDFGSWHYKNDATHVFIYRKQTLEHLVKNLGFQSLKFFGRLVVFSK